MNFTFDNLFNKVGLTEEEKRLITHSSAVKGTEALQAKIVSELYSAKANMFAIEKLIESNEKLARTNSKYSKSLNILTGALVLVGLLQLFFSCIY